VESRHRRIAGLLVVGLTAMGAGLTGAHEGSGQARDELATTFETLVADSCSPCVRESYAVATLPIAPSRPQGFGPAVTSIMARGGEVRLEVVRAYPLARTAEQFFAMRLILWTKLGESALFPIATGLVDEEDIPVVATAVRDIARAAVSRPGEEPAADATEIEFHAGSVRVGTMRTRGGEIAYLQAGNVRLIRAPSPLETTNAMFLAVSDLPALHDAIRQVEDKIKKLRGQ
jgi:hypothetical protein